MGAQLGFTRRPRLLEIPLDGVGVADTGVLRILPDPSQRAPLTQQIPAPIELDRDPLQTLAILGQRRAALGVGLLANQERVLFLDQCFDPGKKRFVPHTRTVSRFRVRFTISEDLIRIG